MRFSILVAILIGWLGAGIAGADETSVAPRTLAITGIGSVQAAPDMAEITVGVVTTAETARDALSANNTQAERVFEVLRASGVADKDMQSTNLSVSPQYRNRRPGDPSRPEIIGYMVNNSLRIAVRDLGAFGKILDEVVSAGANNINGIRFDIAARDMLERAAMKEAVRNARARAAEIAEAAGVKLGPVLTIGETGGFRPPQPFLARAEASAVPIAAGELSIGARVSMVFAIE